MPDKTYRWSGSDARPDQTSATTLGYPWIEVDPATAKAASGTETELADRTADAILADVGDDPTKAAAALKAENERETPRVTLTRKLEKIAE